VSDADADGQKELRQDTQCSVRELCRYQLAAGLIHSLDYQQLHRTFNSHDGAVTLMLTSPPERSFSRVIGSHFEPPARVLSAAVSLAAADIKREVGAIAERVGTER
jgi:hypothetical protein